MEIKKVLESAKFAQVGFVVNDIEETKKKYAMIFACAEPVTIGEADYEIVKTKVFGQPAPDAASKLAFFNLSDGVQLELIEPNEISSVWRDHLNKYGEGIHHIAFIVEDMDETISELEKMGMVVEQEGFYGDGNGRYAYIDAFEQLKCRIELLQNF